MVTEIIPLDLHCLKPTFVIRTRQGLFIGWIIVWSRGGCRENVPRRLCGGSSGSTGFRVSKRDCVVHYGFRGGFRFKRSLRNWGRWCSCAWCFGWVTRKDIFQVHFRLIRNGWWIIRLCEKLIFKKGKLKKEVWQGCEVSPERLIHQSKHLTIPQFWMWLYPTVNTSWIMILSLRKWFCDQWEIAWNLYHHESKTNTQEVVGETA